MASTYRVIQQPIEAALFCLSQLLYYKSTPTNSFDTEVKESNEDSFAYLITFTTSLLTILGLQVDRPLE